MNNASQQIVNRAWAFAQVLRDDGLSYLAYTEQITFLLFLKMAHELTLPPHNRPAIVPKGYDWQSLWELDGSDLERHYREVLDELSREKGVLGEIFKKARPDITNAATLKRLIVELIGAFEWANLPADVKGDMYEGLLSRSASESPAGAGQYFTPRSVIRTMVDVMRPTADDTIADPAAGTGGFLIAAHDFVVENEGNVLDSQQKRHLRTHFVKAFELVANTARLCLMNLYLHGMDGGAGLGEGQGLPLVVSGVDSLKVDPGDRFSMVLANPPFGKKSSFTIVNEEGELEREDESYGRADFWTTTKNKQLNFLQHIYTLLETPGRAAVVLPDNVLFEGGAGETVRRSLMEKCDLHTILRLPTGIFYAQGVKANVLFFDKKKAQKGAWTQQVWVYDARTNLHYTLKQNPLRRSDLDEFVTLYNAENRHQRRATWSEEQPEGRWRAYSYEEIIARDKASLDLFWIKDKSLESDDAGVAPAVLAQEIADELEAASQSFLAVAAELNRNVNASSEQLRLS